MAKEGGRLKAGVGIKYFLGRGDGLATGTGSKTLT